jgi:hypothetical protein
MRTNHNIATIIAAACLVGGLALPVLAGETVRGRDLMNNNEWQAHRTEMLKADTPAERQELRRRMQEQVEQRATEHGVTLQHQVGPGAGFGGGNGPQGGFGGQGGGSRW